MFSYIHLEVSSHRHFLFISIFPSLYREWFLSLCQGFCFVQAHFKEEQEGWEFSEQKAQSCPTISFSFEGWRRLGAGNSKKSKVCVTMAKLIPQVHTNTNHLIEIWRTFELCYLHLSSIKSLLHSVFVTVETRDLSSVALVSLEGPRATFMSFSPSQDHILFADSSTCK